MTGNIPKEIGALVSLQDLGLNSNNFGGFVPREIGNLTELQTLYLGANKFTGKLIFPPWIMN